MLPRCILATATSIPGQCIHRGITTQKVSIFFYSLPQNSEKSANNRFHAKMVKYSNFYDISADVWPILIKFCTMTHISYPEHNSCWKVKFKKTQDGGCCRLKNVKYDISAIISLILIKFAATMHISHCKFNCRSVHSQRDDNGESFNFLLLVTPKQRKNAQITVFMQNWWNI